jgi:hypothetical protein
MSPGESSCRDCLRRVSARQCKDLLPTVDSDNRPWPTWRLFAAGFFPVGQRAARSLPERWPADLPRGIRIPVQGHQLAHKGGAAWSLPLPNRVEEWTPRRATLLCSPPYPCSAQSSLGRRIELFLARSFSRSVQSRFSARFEAPALTWTKTISRSSAPRVRAFPGHRSWSPCDLSNRPGAKALQPSG